MSPRSLFTNAVSVTLVVSLVTLQVSRVRAVEVLASPALMASGFEFRLGEHVRTNGPFTVGNIERSGGHDIHNFDALAGQSYRIRTELGSLRDTTLTVFQRTLSSPLAFNDDAGDGTLASEVVWTAPASGVYHIAVRAYSPYQTGRYAVRIWAPEFTGDLIPEPEFGVVASGREGWHAFYASEGQTHAIAAALGTLPDSVVTVYNASLTTVLDANDDVEVNLPASVDIGDGSHYITNRSSVMGFKAPADGMYYVKVTGYHPTQAGSYGLFVFDPHERHDLFALGFLLGFIGGLLVAVAVSR